MSRAATDPIRDHRRTRRHRRTPSRRLRALLRARAGCRARRTAPRSSSPLEHIVAELDLIALARARRLEDPLELGGVRCLAGDAEAALRSEDPKRAPRGLRPVDEEVDELLLVRGGDGYDFLRRDELEERALQLV